MKKILFILLVSLFCFSARADENNFYYDQPVDNGGQNADLETRINRLLEVARFFSDKYPDNTFETEEAKEEIIDDIQKFHPQMSEEEAIELQKKIVKWLKIYRTGENVYTKYIASKLTPETPLIVESDEIATDSPTNGYVIPENENDVIVVTDIKKVVPYSNTYRDIEAVAVKTARDGLRADKPGEFDDIIYIGSRMEWKKLPFYDVIFPNPFTGNKGIGKWQKKDGISVRITTEQTGVKDADKLSGTINILIPADKLIIANNGRYNRPQADFSSSENIKQWDVQLPLPIRILDKQGNDWSVYFRELSIPFNMSVDDTEKPVLLKADIKLDICTGEQKCYSETFNPELKLQSEYTRRSSIAAHSDQVHLGIPPRDSRHFAIESVAVKDADDFGKYLEAKFLSKTKISDFSVFIDSPDNIAFQAPRVQIEGKRVKVKFLPAKSDTDLVGRNFEITALLNGKYPLRSIITPVKAEKAESTAPRLNWQLLWWAFLGGLILNLMPCVFPVLSIKLLSLTKFGARQNSAVRRNFCYTVSGIFAAMGLLAAFLALLKYFGQSVGWGMQFQNPYFVITMIFAVLLFMLILNDVVTIKIPQQLQKVATSSSSGGLIHFVTGTLVVLMATPCTAPYLGTVVGFALAGSIVDIFAIFAGISLGLAFPYIIFYLCPWLVELIPTPGPWMQKLNRIMQLMLLITMIWLFSIISAQTDFWFVVRLVMYVLLIALLLWLKAVTAEADYENLTPQQKEKALKILKTFFWSLAGVFYIIAMIDVNFAYHRHHSQTEQNTVATLTSEEIDGYVKDGKTVLVAVGADWCLTCKYNELTVFDLPTVENQLQRENVVFIKVDWTNYNREVLHFMEKYHRSGLPFYVLFSPLAPEGFVLPEILDNRDLVDLIINFTLAPKGS